jgi:hypothetical protein
LALSSLLLTSQVKESVAGVIRKEWELISKMYRYYSCLSSHKPSGMPLNDWTELLMTVEIPNNESAHCKVSDCDTIFITANYTSTKEKDVDENALGRFQFIEALARVATARYPSAPDDALKKLFREHFHTKLPIEARYDCNKFRTYAPHPPKLGYVAQKKKHRRFLVRLLIN